MVIATGILYHTHDQKALSYLPTYLPLWWWWRPRFREELPEVVALGLGLGVLDRGGSQAAI